MNPNSEQWGSDRERGKYPAKIYSIDGVLIYQVEDGTTNADKSPLGGVISQSSTALSMLNTIANPITYYGGGSGAVINQSGHSGDLYNYYWTSYSRGTDGTHGNTQWHNVYLDGYIPLRVKSIYDPCPYLYRIPSNGTYNQFNMQTGWTWWSYLGGASWNMTTLGESWFNGIDVRGWNNGMFQWCGEQSGYYTSTTGHNSVSYMLYFTHSRNIYYNNANWGGRSYGLSVRCIDFATLYETIVQC